MKSKLKLVLIIYLICIANLLSQSSPMVRYNIESQTLDTIPSFQIDSLIARYDEDTIFNYVEKVVLVEYESMKLENPIICYPLQVGNYWEFRGSGRHYYEKVIDTKLMPNGKTYKVLERKELIENAVTNYLYRRVEDNSRVYYYNDRNGLESKIYDMELPVGSAWYYIDLFHRRITDIKNEYFALIQDSTKIYYMDDVNIDSSSTPPDTSWTHLYDDFAVGVGTILLGDLTGYWTLRGAIINGISYGSISVGVVDQPEQLPKDFILTQNYPNPFNPNTTIKYSIPSIKTHSHASVQLVVYDILGREVATLVNKEQSPGNYEVQFDASGLTSGIYFYKLQGGSFVESRKMILIR